MAFDVLAIAGLLADHEQRGVLAAFAEHRLRTDAPQRTRAAAGRGRAQPGEGLRVGRVGCRYGHGA